MNDAPASNAKTAPADQGQWTLPIEISGISVVHLKGAGATEARSAEVLLSGGGSGRHCARMYVPASRLDEASVWTSEARREAFGLQWIPITGGEFLLEIRLDGASVTFEGVLQGPVKYNLQPDADAASWDSLANAINVRDLATKAGQDVSLDKVDSRVSLPAGTLTATEPRSPTSQGKFRVTKGCEHGNELRDWARISDRLRLSAEFSTAVIMLVTKGATTLPLKVKNAPSVGISITCLCPAREDNPQELDEFSTFMSGRLRTWTRDEGVTPDHSCPTGYLLSA